MPARPTSDEAKRAAGTFTPARERNSAKFKAGVPQMPENFPDSARVVWERTVPKLVAAGILSDAYHGLLVAYCVEEGRFEQDWGASMSVAAKSYLRLLRADLGLGPSDVLKVPALEPEEAKWKPERDSGKVVSISKLLSGTPKASPEEASMPATTSELPAKDS